MGKGKDTEKIILKLHRSISYAYGLEESGRKIVFLERKRLISKFILLEYQKISSTEIYLRRNQLSISSE